MYVIKKTDQGGGYVAKDGNEHSYTHDIEEAKVFKTRQQAELNLCPENETVVRIGSVD